MSGSSTLSEIDRKFLGRLQSTIGTVEAWDADPMLLAECRLHIPFDTLIQDYSNNDDDDDDYALEGNLLFLQCLARYFQKSVMTWVNSPPCENCGHTKCDFISTRGPETLEEREGGASRVELYNCPQCGHNNQFPRYNSVRKLLETRCGRCGEYANLFGLFCRAAGFETRYVLDVTDHVWTEVFINDQWIMADSCEGVIGRPSMYEHGWGKQGLSYMIAVANDHVQDVTPRYTRKWSTTEFQTRRRNITSSEDISQQIISSCNQTLQQKNNANANKIQELNRRLKLEQQEFTIYKQATSWAQEEQYGQGRISGALSWKVARQEAGSQPGNNNNNNSSNKNDTENSSSSSPKGNKMGSFEIESFHVPSTTMNLLSIIVRPKPTKRHGEIVISGMACAVGEPKTISIVVLDQDVLGCVLQSRSFQALSDLSTFIDTLPRHRIIAMHGTCTNNAENTTTYKALNRLGLDASHFVESILYIGQVDACPDWKFCSTFANHEDGHEIQLEWNVSTNNHNNQLSLKTEQSTKPRRVAGRIPESVMPLATQQLASHEQKRMAFLSFTDRNKYSGYTTKTNTPIYLLDASGYPLQKSNNSNNDKDDDCWHTFYYLPTPLVPENDQGIKDDNNAKDKQASIPKFDVPLSDNFLDQLGPQLLVNGTTPVPTADALHNARLIGLYFSAHWCPPCRQFTPMLAEMYEIIKEKYPTHGLEIVFISSDRDASSYQNYYDTMPWKALPYGTPKDHLSMIYGRALPSLVIFDAISGQVVIPVSESRREVVVSCQGGDWAIETMFATWLERVPQDSQELISMLEMSCEEPDDNDNNNDRTNQEGVKEHPYLIRTTDPAARIKELHTQLVQQGHDPNEAAAKAIQILAQEQQQQQQQGTGKLEPGPLDGKAKYMGIPMDDNNNTIMDNKPAKEMIQIWKKQYFYYYYNSSQTSTTSNNDNEITLSLEVLFKTCLKYVENVNKEPWNPKFRSFKVSNKVADRITRIPGGLLFIQNVLGFDVIAGELDYMISIPLITNLDKLHNTLTLAVQAIQEEQK